MEASPKIRRLTIADYDRLIELWERAGLSYRPRGRDTREKVGAEMTVSPQAYLGMFIDERLVAFVLATFYGRKGWINRLAVDPDFRGRGYGARMIAEAERVLRQAYGAQIIAALVEPENEPSRQLFDKCGYVCWEGLYYFSKRDHPDV